MIKRMSFAVLTAALLASSPAYAGHHDRAPRVYNLSDGSTVEVVVDSRGNGLTRPSTTMSSMFHCNPTCQPIETMTGQGASVLEQVTAPVTGMISNIGSALARRPNRNTVTVHGSTATNGNVSGTNTAAGGTGGSASNTASATGGSANPQTTVIASPVQNTTANGGRSESSANAEGGNSRTDVVSIVDNDNRNRVNTESFSSVYSPTTVATDNAIVDSFNPIDSNNTIDSFNPRNSNNADDSYNTIDSFNPIDSNNTTVIDLSPPAPTPTPSGGKG